MMQIDTVKIEKAGENIKIIAKEYNKIIEEIFDKIKKLEESGAWIGEGDDASVKVFTNIVMQEKEPYSNYGINIYNLGQWLIDYSKNINTITDNKIGG